MYHILPHHYLSYRVSFITVKINKNTLWQHAIHKEIENVKVTFQIIPEGENPPTGFHYDNCHIVFDMKMKDFHRKAHLVVGGHITHTPDIITYSSVVTTETVCIALTMGALHDLEVKAADV